MPRLITRGALPLLPIRLYGVTLKHRDNYLYLCPQHLLEQRKRSGLCACTRLQLCVPHWPSCLRDSKQIYSYCCSTNKQHVYYTALHRDVNHYSLFKPWDSSVGIATGYGPDDWMIGVRFPAGAGNFSLHHRVQNGSGAHKASYPKVTRASFPGSKAAGTWSWPLTSI
jgi:hypothetical protein